MLAASVGETAITTATPGGALGEAADEGLDEVGLGDVLADGDAVGGDGSGDGGDAAELPRPAPGSRSATETILGEGAPEAPTAPSEGLAPTWLPDGAEAWPTTVTVTVGTGAAPAASGATPESANGA